MPRGESSFGDQGNRGAAFGRRALMLGAMALGSGALIGLDRTTADAASVPTVVNASALYVDFSAGQAKRRGTSVALASAATGDGAVRSAATNLLGSMLPLAGGSIATNTLPQGLEWHSQTAPKTLIGVSSTGIGFGAKTTAASPDYFGGVRTTTDVVQPGQTVLLSFKGAVSALNGNPNASVMAYLLRTSDQKTTMGVRVLNAQEAINTRATARLKAPAGGTGGYRLVLTVQAGASLAGQSANIYFSEFVLIAEPASAPTIGSRYSIPPYFAKSSVAKSLILAPLAPAGMYNVVIRTDEFGWGAQTAAIAGTSSVVDLKSLFGASVNFTAREAYVVAQSSWQKNWMDLLSPTPTWVPARYLNIANTVTKSRAESPNALSRMSGMPAALSAIAQEGNGNLPLLGAPATTWAVGYNSARLSHQSFGADTVHYIGDAPGYKGIHSEIWAEPSVTFDQDEWISFWTRTFTPILDAPGLGEAVLFQYRYVNSTGDTSAFSPDLALSQMPGNQFQLRFRSDLGTPVYTGDSTAKGIVTGQSPLVAYRPGEWNAVVVRVRFSAAGGGYLAFWLNGVKVVDQSAPVGYSRPVGPRLHYGTYKYSDYRHAVEYQHMEHGTRDLSSRIAAPLPV